MRFLVLGTGMQGRAAVHYLATSGEACVVTAADRDPGAARTFADRQGYGTKVKWVSFDAGDRAALWSLLRGGHDVVIDLLPVPFIGAVAEAAIAAGLPLVNTFYPTEELRALGPAAREKGVILLPELGMDPGIDLLLLGDAARRFDRVTEVLSYGAGLPEPEAANTPIRYKISWTFEGVLRSYRRPARLLRDGRLVQIPDSEQFRPEHGHTVTVDGVGPLEAFPNGDALTYLDLLGIDPGQVRHAGRYALRYPGHSAFWRTMVDLHLLDEEPVTVDGVAVDRRRFLARALEPHLQYAPGERDMGILRVEVAGERGGIASRIVHEVIDRLDPRTGLSAMSRLVGFTAGAGAQMLARGDIVGAGLRSPLTDVPFAPLMSALAARGITVTTTETPARAA